MSKVIETISLLLEVLKSGNVMAIIALLLLVFYIVPLLVVAGLSYDNTNRLERAQREGTAQTVNAIDRLGNHLNIRTAKK